MSDLKPVKQRGSFLEKLVRRTLETVGGSIDALFGRGRKKPDALPSTGDLGERLRRLIDSQVRTEKDGRRTAPHYIKLKYLWGQTSDEFHAALAKLRNELLIIAIDHINDNRYATLGAPKIETKSDVLTKGFSLSIGFSPEDATNAEKVELPASMFASLLPNNLQIAPPNTVAVTVNLTFPNGMQRERILEFPVDTKKNLVVGRIRECDLFIDDASVSKRHASLVMSADGNIKVADIGSSNGTFINGERVAYGKGYELHDGANLKFGDVGALLRWETPQPETFVTEAETESATVFAGNNEITIGVTSQLPDISTFDSNEPETVFHKNAAEFETVIGGKQNADDEPETVMTDFETNQTTELETLVGAETGKTQEIVTQNVVAPPANVTQPLVADDEFKTNFMPPSNDEFKTNLAPLDKETMANLKLTAELAKKQTTVIQPEHPNDFTGALDPTKISKS